MHVLRAAILNPRESIGVDYHPDGILAHADGRIRFIGDAAEYRRQGGDPDQARPLPGVLMPPMLDIHTHVPQWPIRGRFLEGVPENPPRGRLLAGLERNVFPAELQFADEALAAEVIERFRIDTLSNGVAGGCVFMTIHAAAASLAFDLLGDDWLIGPVLMDQNCPPGLRSGIGTVQGPLKDLARRHGPRLVPADRFAAACSSPLRRAGVALAREYGLRMQTHLAEQPAEVALVRSLYPAAGSYTQVYADDGLLDCRAILAHCIHLADPEWRLLRDSGATIAHCPASNTLLGSGVMSLEAARRWGVPFALATDVGASPTTSLLAEARQFLFVHEGEATPEEALWRITQAPVAILEMEDRFGRLRDGSRLAYVVVDVEPEESAGQTIGRILGMEPGGDRVQQPTHLDAGEALSQLRSGRPRFMAVERLTAAFVRAAGQVRPIREIVLNGREHRVDSNLP